MTINKERIEREAKQILDKFAEALEEVDEVKIDSYVDREEFERVEGTSKFKDLELSINPKFKKAVLKNAPQKDDDFIITERGSWK